MKIIDFEKIENIFNYNYNSLFSINWIHAYINKDNIDLFIKKNKFSNILPTDILVFHWVWQEEIIEKIKWWDQQYFTIQFFENYFEVLIEIYEYILKNKNDKHMINNIKKMLNSDIKSFDVKGERDEIGQYNSWDWYFWVKNNHLYSFDKYVLKYNYEKEFLNIISLLQLEYLYQKIKYYKKNENELSDKWYTLNDMIIWFNCIKNYINKDIKELKVNNEHWHLILSMLSNNKSNKYLDVLFNNIFLWSFILNIKLKQHLIYWEKTYQKYLKKYNKWFTNILMPAIFNHFTIKEIEDQLTDFFETNTLYDIAFQEINKNWIYQHSHFYDWYCTYLTYNNYNNLNKMQEIFELEFNHIFKYNLTQKEKKLFLKKYNLYLNIRISFNNN